MTTRNDRILDWAIKKVQLEYSNDVCLLVVYGSYINDTADSLSDLDFYFIPKNERVYMLARTFIIEGIGYDLFPMSWERVEGLATLDEPLTPLLGDAEIVYAGTNEDRKRFERLQEILHKNLSDPEFMHQKAVDKLSKAIEGWNTLIEQIGLCNTRLFAGEILLHLADAVAYENLTYFKNSLKTQFTDLKTMLKLPVGFIEGYQAVIKANTIVLIQESCKKLLDSCQQFLNYSGKTMGQSSKNDISVHQSQEIDFKQLADLYGEIISTFNKVYKYCESDEYILAFISAVNLQQILNEDAQGLYFDVLSAYDAKDLSRLSASVKSVESYLVKYITSGATIRRYASVDEFLKEN